MWSNKIATILFITLKYAYLVGCARRIPFAEEERIAEYHRRGHTWPIQEFVPNTEGWVRLMKQRLVQVQSIEDRGPKYNAFFETMASAVTMANFSEFGWGLTKAPQSLTDDLRKAIYDGLPDAHPEGVTVAVDGESPLFIHRPDLGRRVSVLNQKANLV
jgi:hypothetical protein